MKLLLVGDFGVGKTSILFRYMDNTYAENDKLSIGLEFKIKYCMFEGKLIKTMIWDTTGEKDLGPSPVLFIDHLMEYCYYMI